MKVLKIKRINDKARLPQYAQPGDAGLDLYSVESIDINPGDSALVKTG
jgi:dUTP pyrophosphatase